MNSDYTPRSQRGGHFAANPCGSTVLRVVSAGQRDKMWPSALTSPPALHASVSTPATILLSMAADLDGKEEHLVWQPGFGQQFSGTLLFAGAVLVAASRSSGAWVHGMTRIQQLAFRLEWCVGCGRSSSPNPDAQSSRVASRSTPACGAARVVRAVGWSCDDQKRCHQRSRGASEVPHARHCCYR